MQKPDSNYSAASTWGGVGGFCICLLLAAAGIALFWPVVGYDFIALDDAVYFAENEHVLAGLTWHNLAWAFQSTLDASWYPLSWLSFMLDAELFGRGSAGPHLTNMLLHVANGILLFLLWERLTGSLWRSALVAALFVLHPLHVESVAWVSERKDVLSTCFGLLAMIAYVTRIASFGVLYGSVAAPLLVILWTFYSANIFLYAASVSASIQARHNKALASRTPRE